MERLSDTYRILISEQFLEDIKMFKGYTYMENIDSERAHDKVKTYWLIKRDNFSDQAALNEILLRYVMFQI